MVTEANEAETFTMTLSADGEVTLPAAVRDRLKWRAGTVLECELRDDKLVLRRESPAAQRARLFGPPVDLESLVGIMRIRALPGPPRSMKEMREIARADVARRWCEAEARNALALDDDPG